MPFRFLPAFILLAAPPLPAQGAVGPLVASPIREWTDLSPTRLQVAQIKSISAIELPGDPPGTYYLGLTVTGLPAARGGQGADDVLSGRYDVLTGTWTEDGAAAPLNTPAASSTSLHASGLVAAVDDYTTGQVVIARRATLTAPFARLGTVQGLPTQPYYDPALATVDGQLHLLAMIAFNVVMMPLDLTTLQVGPATVLAQAPAGEEGNSAQPIVDRNGEMIGPSFHSLPHDFSRNDHRVAYDFTTATPDFLVTSTGDWISNGTYLGGHYLMARDNALGYRLVGYDMVWSGGGRTSLGTNMAVDTFAPTSATTSWHGFLLVAPSFTAPVSVPIASGALGLPLNPLIFLDVGPHAAATGRATFQLAIPNDPALAGARIPAQPLSLELSAARLYLGNTCLLSVR